MEKPDPRPIGVISEEIVNGNFSKSQNGEVLVNGIPQQSTFD
jgi:hypothetical protein